jgi:hypothetical protein
MIFETGFSKPETDRKRPEMIRICNKISIQNPPEKFSGLERKSVGFCVINSNGSRNRISTLKGQIFSGLEKISVPLWWAHEHKKTICLAGMGATLASGAAVLGSAPHPAPGPQHH